MPSGLRPIRSTGSTTFLTVIVVIAVLYFARVVFIPLALSILLTFLFAPMVIRLRRSGFGRISAASMVLCLAFVVLVIVGIAMTVQVGDLARSMPAYEANMRKKVDVIRESPLASRVTKMVRDINTELASPKSQPGEPVQVEEKAVPVEIREDAFAPVDMFQRVLGPVVEVVIMGGIVLVFVIFMLMQREDLRDRIIHLAGATRVNVTTQLLDDAARRVSRFLLAQLVINVSYSVLATIGLYFIGIPNPLLWGMLAVVLRYVPFIGIWIAALLPAMVAFAVDPGWAKAITVLVLYFGIDLFIINFAEPLVYGNSTGVSPIAILIATVFWTWLWGPMGLLLATPLTVCVVVLGRYVPNLRFLSVMLSDEKVLPPETKLYQRMLAMDLDEATEVAEEYLKIGPLEDLYDEVIVPALRMVEEEQHRGALDDIRQKFVYQNMRLLIDDIAERADELTHTTAVERKAALPLVAETPKVTVDEVMVVCLPARDEADALGAHMLMTLLVRRGINAKATAPSLAAECIDAVEQYQAAIACVVCVPPSGYLNARYLCRRLIHRVPGLKIVAANLAGVGPKYGKTSEPRIPADDHAVTLKEALAQVLGLVPVATQRQSIKAA